MDVYDIQEKFSFHTRLGYGSRYDEDYLDIDLCCECMDKIIDECLISPITECGFWDEYDEEEDCENE